MFIPSMIYSKLLGQNDRYQCKQILQHAIYLGRNQRDLLLTEICCRIQNMSLKVISLVYMGWFSKKPKFYKFDSQCLRIYQSLNILIRKDS